MSPAVVRARAQIAAGERLALARRGYVTRSECVDAMHHLIPDGGAARQGDDPAWLVERPGLADLYPRAIENERGAARGWSHEEWAVIRASLHRLGPTREKDIARLARHRIALLEST